jgi:hypothetical protein
MHDMEHTHGGTFGASSIAMNRHIFFTQPIAPTTSEFVYQKSFGYMAYWRTKYDRWISILPI